MTYGYPDAWVYAAGRGFMAGRYSDVDLYEHDYFRSIPAICVWERFCFRFQFERGREIQQDRIAAGIEQPPGSIYDPRLDDRRSPLGEPLDQVKQAKKGAA